MHKERIKDWDQQSERTSNHIEARSMKQDMFSSSYFKTIFGSIRYQEKRKKKSFSYVWFYYKKYKIKQNN